MACEKLLHRLIWFLKRMPSRTVKFAEVVRRPAESMNTPSFDQTKTKVLKKRSISDKPQLWI